MTQGQYKLEDVERFYPTDPQLDRMMGIYITYVNRQLPNWEEAKENYYTLAQYYVDAKNVNDELGAQVCKDWFMDEVEGLEKIIKEDDQNE